MPPPKRKCVFNPKLQEEYPFIKKTVSDSDVRCNTCASSFNVSHGGRSDISHHLKSEKHQTAVRASASSSLLTNFFKNQSFGDAESKLAAAEGVFVYHTVQHNQSFRSLDCTSKLMQCVFEPKFTCGRTKAEAVLLNVLSPFATSLLESDLEKVNFVSFMRDASNHKDTKLFPILERYYTPAHGICIKLLQLKSLPGETAQIVSTYLIECFESFNLREKVVAFCADNTNCNFGGVARRGEKNIFKKLKLNLGRDLLGVGCNAHIIHNTIQTAADVLPVDIEGIVSKIYSYFYLYTVRVESLKEFCEFVDQEYKQILGYSKTRWLALLPAVERLLVMFVPLKSFFQSQDKCPIVVKLFFEDRLSEASLYFIHNQASTFHTAVLKIEGETVTVFEVLHTLCDLKANLASKGDDCFITSAVRTILTNLEKDGFGSEVAKFRQYVHTFYKVSAEYLAKWTEPLEHLKEFGWVNLKETPTWEEIRKAADFVKKIYPAVEMDETALYDEYMCIKQYATSEKLLKWKSEKKLPDQCWMELFYHFNSENITYSNILKILEFFFCLPGTNAPTERVFSHMNALWTSDKTQLSINTLKAMLITKVNLNYTCADFYKLLCQKKELLKKIHSSEKYQL